jgi:hypothetical protein
MDRLAAFRDADGHSLAGRIAALVGTNPDAMAICSTDACDAALVRTVADFLASSASSRETWETGHPHLSAESLLWSGVRILIIRGNAGTVHLVAPAETAA